MSPGATGTSPQSTTPSASSRSSPKAGWYGRSSAEADRIASGPNRGPGRKLVPVSNGIPTAAASTPSSSVTCGSRMKVLIPAKRGITCASSGRKRVTRRL